MGKKGFRDCCACGTTSCRKLEVSAAFGHAVLVTLPREVARASTEQSIVHPAWWFNTNHYAT